MNEISWSALPLDTWVYIAVCYDSSRTTVYINGSRVDEEGDKGEEV